MFTRNKFPFIMVFSSTSHFPFLFYLNSSFCSLISNLYTTNVYFFCFILLQLPVSEIHIHSRFSLNIFIFHFSESASYFLTITHLSTGCKREINMYISLYTILLLLLLLLFFRIFFFSRLLLSFLYSCRYQIHRDWEWDICMKICAFIVKLRIV